MYDITSDDYIHRVYAGVLGKMIGVYLGRPIEGMLYRDILKQLGPINYYVHEQRKRMLVMSDDDLSGTFTFVRALEDFPDAGKSLTPQQIGQTWLNYVIENKTIFWWGGLGLSTEHTAFLRLKNGIPAPRSGSIELNSKVVAEQIGSQIFIDGWAMIAPGDPELAADFARKAASVSHDGEAIYGAQVIAAMEAAAFVENDISKLLDIGTRFIPKNSIISRMIADLRELHAKHPDDWEKAMIDVMEKSYGYDKYGGNCHMIPNHGIIVLALLYGRDSFQHSQMIANTCGWDTDCNAGNVGCLMGIKNGLAGIDAGPDWRGPVADRLLIPTADGGECITDAVKETYRLVNIGRLLQKRPPLAPKNGARFHFSLPGSVQGFREEMTPESKGTTRLSNTDGRLAIQFTKLAQGQVARASTSTFAPTNEAGNAYGVYATPTVSSGQTITASLGCELSTGSSIDARLYLRHYSAKEVPVRILGPLMTLTQGKTQILEWKVPQIDGQPIFEVGIELSGEDGATGTAYLDWLTWFGAPNVTLGIPNIPGETIRRQWVDALDVFQNIYTEAEPNQVYRFINNAGRGMAIHGTREWTDYTVTTTLTPHLAQAAGIAIRVQGLKRYYALLLRHPNRIALVKMLNDEQTLAEAPFAWRWNDDPHELTLTAKGNRLIGKVDGKLMFDVEDKTSPLTSGAMALIVDDGRVASGAVRIRPIEA